MIDLPWDPVLVLGPFRTTWHALFGVLGMAAGAAVGVALAASRVGAGRAYGVALAGLGGGLAGSRLFHVVDEWSRYAADPLTALAVWNGGASIVGGVVGGVLAGLLVARRDGLPTGVVLDAGAAGLPVGMAVGRIGDLVNGEHWATACAGLAWCVRYTHPDSPGQREPVHPAVAYELLLDVAILAVVLALRGRGLLRDRLMFVFLGLYGIGRFALGGVRLDPQLALGLSQAQLVALAFVLVAVAGLARRASYARS